MTFWVISSISCEASARDNLKGSGPAGCDADSREADLVAQRIVELLERAPFVLALETLSEIHCYRDALVRVMYRNAAVGIFPDESFLTAFYENVLGRAAHELDREELLCAALFENPGLIRNVNPTEALHGKTAAGISVSCCKD